MKPRLFGGFGRCIRTERCSWPKGRRPLKLRTRGHRGMMPNQKQLKLNCWRSRRLVVAVLSLWALARPAEKTKPAQDHRPPIAIAEVRRTAPIEFYQECRPLLH